MTDIAVFSTLFYYLFSVDGRNDSPGHCAQYCSYTTMENETKEIIHVATVDKRQTSWNSVIMEWKAFMDTMNKLITEIKLVEICTCSCSDRSPYEYTVNPNK